jgi:hypothetical protein
MLARLDVKIAYHREQGELHARQEKVHAEQRALHEAELSKALEQSAALKASAAAVGELIADVEPSAPSPASPPEKVLSGGWHWIADLMARVIATKAPGEVFGASTLIAEIEERWGSQLRREVDARSAATTLRHWAAAGLLDVVRKGRPHHEGLYTKPRQADEE